MNARSEYNQLSAELIALKGKHNAERTELNQRHQKEKSELVALYDQARTRVSEEKRTQAIDPNSRRGIEGRQQRIRTAILAYMNSEQEAAAPIPNTATAYPIRVLKITADKLQWQRFLYAKDFHPGRLSIPVQDIDPTKLTADTLLDLFPEA